METPHVTQSGGHTGAARGFDHHELERSLGSVIATLQAVDVRGDVRAVEARAARSALRQLEVDLAHHFRFETGSSGFFAEVLDAVPETVRRLEALAAEHGGLAAELRDVVSAAREAGQSATAWGRVLTRFDAFAAHLRRHENAEDGVVADALTHDDGSVC